MDAPILGMCGCVGPGPTGSKDTVAAVSTNLVTFVAQGFLAGIDVLA